MYLDLIANRSQRCCACWWRESFTRASTCCFHFYQLIFDVCEATGGLGLVMTGFPRKLNTEAKQTIHAASLHLSSFSSKTSSLSV